MFYISIWFTNNINKKSNRNDNENASQKITYDVIGAAIEIHKSLGPGLLESVYHECIKHKLTLRNISFLTEISMPVRYKGIEVATI